MKSSRTPPSLGPKWDFRHYGLFQYECNVCKIRSSSAYECNPSKLTDTLTVGSETMMKNDPIDSYEAIVNNILILTAVSHYITEANIYTYL